MKNIKLLFPLIVCFVVVSCGGSLPAKNSIATGTGIIAIPKSARSDHSLPVDTGWLTEIEIKHTASDDLAGGKAVRLVPARGKQFVFIKDVAPGFYKMANFRRVPVSDTAKGKASTKRDIMLSDSFRVRAGEVTVVPMVSHISVEETGYASAVSRQSFLLLGGDLLDEFKALMQKKNAKNEWQVNWP